MKKIEASIITTYRCMNRCQMCFIWKNPTSEEEEFKPSLLEKLPELSFCNITGGEPFLREDIDEIIDILNRKSDRIVISTNGYLTDRILFAAKHNKNLGIRISLEGLAEKNDMLRGLKNSFDRGLRTLLELKRLGSKDIGIAVTVSDENADDLIDLYLLSKKHKVEFATAAVHNSYYFHKYDNRINNKNQVITQFEKIIKEQLKTWNIKTWYRAYFNKGLINYISGKERLLPCTAGTDMFFLDPWGEVRPCNGMEQSIWMASFGNLHDLSFNKIWNSQKAEKIRNSVKNCSKNCWMIGTVSPVIKRYPLKPTLWVMKNKFLSLFG
jgi:radical SAM protein with 4Fe4S-binding SPASM domain